MSLQVRHRFVTPCYVRVTIRHGVARLRPVEAVIGLLLGREHQLSAAPPRCQEPGYQVAWALRWVRHRGPCREARRLVADGVAPLRPVEAVIGLLLGREHQLSAAPPRCQEPGYQVAWALRWVRHRGPWYSRTMGQPDDYSPDDDSGRDKRDDWTPTLDGARMT